MSPYRKVETRTYGDQRFRALSRPEPCGQYLWLWLLTGPATCIIPGVVHMGPAGMAELIGWPIEGFREAFNEISRQGMVKADFDAHLVFIPKAIKHNAPQSPNVITGWRGVWAELPECALKAEIWNTLKTSVQTLSEAFREAFDQACPKPMPNQEQEQEQELEQEQKDTHTPFAPSRTANAPNLDCEGVFAIGPLKDGAELTITADDVQELADSYPASDVVKQLRKMREWLVGATESQRWSSNNAWPEVHSWLRSGQYDAHPISLDEEIPF